jgi:hypothetical protein
MWSRHGFLISALAAFLAMGFTGAQAQDLAQDMSKYDMSKYPDWSGQWMKPRDLGNGLWDPTKPRAKGQQAPLTPEYQAIYESRLAEHDAGGLGDDPTAQCIPHGMPRMMVGVYPMELVVTPKTTYMLSDYNEPRRIFTDGRDWPGQVEPTFNGYSIGKWIDEDHNGRLNLLEVESRGFKGPRTYEGSGIPLHTDGQSIIKERFYLDKADQNLLHIDVTTIDHALTRPWAVSRPYRREADPIWMFVDCSEDNRHVWVGRDSYFVSADGYLMPTKKDQAPPDLRYFKRR